MCFGSFQTAARRVEEPWTPGPRGSADREGFVTRGAGDSPGQNVWRITGVLKKQKTKTLILDYNNISSLMLNHQLWVIELILWYFLYIQEIERVWCQYERMESELSVVRSQLQHICNFGMPQVILHYKPNSFCLIRPMASQRNFVKVCTTSIEKFASNLMILMWGVGLKMWNSLIFWCSMWIMSMFYPIRSNLRLRESCGWWRTYSMD